MSTTNETEASGDILGKAALERFYRERDGALPFLIACLEEQEDWILDSRGTPIEGILIRGLNERMQARPPVDREPEETAMVLNYLQAGRMLRILDWLDQREENTITRWLENPDIDPAFRNRLQRLLGILARGALLQKLFDPESSRVLGKAVALLERKDGGFL
ncbi:hypothetical protein AB4090_04795 [Acidithiobacillus sp. IBUN Pt1247-S3]|uniref:type IVB secretion system protein IcmW n=1 Tax=Acidithiobacillus sp. IBUN Pt1247-S3 TaxID=3166642 RepID=UPI0034E5E9FF